MENYLLAFAGIIVSVALYILGYSQTIGARKERIRAANNAFEKALIKRILLENFQPENYDLTSIRNGMAFNHSVKPDDLITNIELYENIYTEIFENDFIPIEKRKNILSSLSGNIAELKRAENEEEYPSSYSFNYISLMTAGIATLIGVFISIVPNLFAKQGIAIPVVIIVVIISVLAMGFFYYAQSKETKDTEKVVSHSKGGYDFENKVRNILEEKGVTVVHTKIHDGFDFILTKGEIKIILEIKANPNLDSLRSAIRKLAQVLDQQQAKEGIIITSKRRFNPSFFSDVIKEKRIRVLSLNELNEYLDENLPF